MYTNQPDPKIPSVEWVRALINDLKNQIASIVVGTTGQAIIVTSGSFIGNNAPPIAALAGLTPDTQFMVYGGGLLLEVNTDYTFAGTTITVPTGATTLRIVIL